MYDLARLPPRMTQEYFPGGPEGPDMKRASIQIGLLPEW